MQLKLAMHKKHHYDFSTSFDAVIVFVVVVKLACNQIYMCQQCLYALRTVGHATIIIAAPPISKRQAQHQLQQRQQQQYIFVFV